MHVHFFIYPLINMMPGRARRRLALAFADLEDDVLAAERTCASLASAASVDS
jgi:hypothetical protein